METLITSILEILSFLVISYFIFYKSWLKELGKEVAKLSTIEDLTRTEEIVKKEFNELRDVLPTKIELIENECRQVLSPES